MSRKRTDMGQFDSRIRWYHLKKKPWVLTIKHIGTEDIPDLFHHDPPSGEIITATDGDTFNPYAPPPERKRGYPIPTKKMPVLWFEELGSQKSFVLNSMNRRTLIERFGTDSTDWKQVVVTLSWSKTPQGADTVLLEIGGDVATQTPAAVWLKQQKQKAANAERPAPPADLKDLINPNL